MTTSRRDFMRRLLGGAAGLVVADPETLARLLHKRTLFPGWTAPVPAASSWLDTAMNRGDYNIEISRRRASPLYDNGSAYVMTIVLASESDVAQTLVKGFREDGSFTLEQNDVFGTHRAVDVQVIGIDQHFEVNMPGRTTVRLHVPSQPRHGDVMSSPRLFLDPKEVIHAPSISPDPFSRRGSVFGRSRV